MRYIFLTIIFLVTLFHLPNAYSSPELSNQCAKISTVVNFTKKNQRNLGLVTHNGKKLNVPSQRITSNQQKGLLASVPMVIALEPGYHEFSVIQSKSRNTSKISTKNREISPLDDESTTRSSLLSDVNFSRTEYYFGIEVLPNKIYKLVLQETKPKTLAFGKRFHVVVASIKDTQCDSNNIRNALPRDKIVNHTKKLPKALQFRLDVLSKDIQTYYKQFDIEDPSLDFFFPARKEENFGTVIAMDEQPSQGLRLLAVAPVTTASMLGLQHSDKIVSINEKSLTDEESIAEAFKVFQEEIFNAEAGDAINLEIIRDGKTMKLTADYSLITLPEVKLSLKLPTKTSTTIK